jgi:1-acyl-sn-glycerol-3-phosphate acyltransferase
MDPTFRAQLFFAVLFVGTVCFIWRNIASKDFTLPQWCLWVSCIFITRVLWCVRIPRLEIATRERGVVFIANHRSSIDPFYFQSRLFFPMHWMVAREYCEHPAFRWFLKQCEVIPVNRGGVDIRSTKSAINLAQQGGAVGMFPEGRINTTDRLMLPVRPGVVLTALRANALIVPCHIEGSPFDKTAWSPFFMAARVRIRVGTPIDLNGEDAERFKQDEAGKCMREIVRQIALLANQPDFEPQLAGRRWKPDSL